MPHINHPAIVRRLKRADGHLQKIIEMIEAGKPCVQLAQQLQAVESHPRLADRPPQRAIENAKKALIHDHIGHCLDESFRKAHAGVQINRAISMMRHIRKRTGLVPDRGWIASSLNCKGPVYQGEHRARQHYSRTALFVSSASYVMNSRACLGRS
jgi:uncharacterized protein